MKIKITIKNYDFFKRLASGDYDAINKLELSISEFEKSNTISCKECGSVFVGSNANATYCEICKKNMGSIRYKNRRNNKERFLHKTISDQLRLIDETLSNNFLNESNYYWDIVQGKIQTVNTSYRDDITTKDDYMKWLKEKKKQYEEK